MIDLNNVSTAPIHYDLDAVVAGLRDTAYVWVPRLFQKGRRQGDEWRLANIRGDAPRQSGSCVITLTGEHAGDWYDFDGDRGGGPLSTLENGTELSGLALFAHAAEMVGWGPTSPVRHEPPPAVAKSERSASQEMVLILKGSMPIAGSLAEAYLHGRGLAAPNGMDLLFHPDLTHWETKTGYPGMIGVVRDAAGEPAAIHRTYLREDPERSTVNKAAVAKPRMTLGKINGGAVRLAAIGPEGTLGLSEGIETGLAVMTACSGFPAWATLSTSGLEQVRLPPEARRIVILADNDVSSAGMRAAEAAARRLRDEGRHVVIAVPLQPGEDFNDLLLRGGAEAVSAVIKAALCDNQEPDNAAQTLIGRHLPMGFSEPSQPLSILRADEGDLGLAVHRAWTILIGSNRNPWLFRVFGAPSWIIPDDDGRPNAAPLTEDRLRHMLAKMANWRKINRNGELVPASPPIELVKSLLATPDPSLPVLTGIVATPVFGQNGALLTEPGYHADARLLYHPYHGFTVPSIPSQPSAAEIEMARSLLLNDLLGDFPFIGHAERAHAMAILLLHFLRAMVDGPTPLHLIEKPSPGTGATLMVDAIATILTGAGASVMTEGRDDDEWRKRVTAKLRQIPTMVLIDNLRNELESSALAAALTAPFWEDRILGVSEMTRLPIRCIWIATGNNPSFSNEMARRLIRIRLDARVDQPWRREAFRHPDLMGWVRANRAKLVAACLTLGQAWIAAGRPRGLRSVGSFENWAQTIGGVFDVAGIEGFLGNIDEMMEASDSEDTVWRAFVEAWWNRFGTVEVSTADLYELTFILELPLPIDARDEQGRRIKLGKALGKTRDRTFRLASCEVQLKALGVRHQAQRWRLALSPERA